MKKFLSEALLVFLFTVLTSAALRAQTKIHRIASPEWVVQFFHPDRATTEAGLEAEVMNWKEVAEEAKREGVILGYILFPAVYSPKSKSYPDLMMMSKVDNTVDLSEMEKRITDIAEKFPGGGVRQKQPKFSVIDMQRLFRGVLAQ